MVVAHHRDPLLANRPDHVRGRPSRGEIHPYGHRVEEQSDGFVDADEFAGPACHGGSDDDVRGARVVARHHRNCRCHQGIQGHTEFVGPGVQPLGEHCREGHDEAPRRDGGIRVGMAGFDSAGQGGFAQSRQELTPGLEGR